MTARKRKPAGAADRKEALRAAQEGLEKNIHGWTQEADGKDKAQDDEEEMLPIIPVHDPDDETADAEGELTAGQKRRLWEKERAERLAAEPDAMAFHDEAVERAVKGGMLERFAKANGLTHEQALSLWQKSRRQHSEAVTALAAQGLTGGFAEEEDARPAIEKPREEEEEVVEDELETPSAGNETHAPESANMTEDEPTEKEIVAPLAAADAGKVPADAPAGKECSAPATPSGPALLKTHMQTDNKPLDPKTRRRLINEEIGREEYQHTQEALQALLEEKPSRAAAFVLRHQKRLTRALCLMLAAAAFFYGGAVWLFASDSALARGLQSARDFFTIRPAVAVVDRRAVRGALLELAQTESLERVLKATDDFDALFQRACVEVAMEENLMLLTADCVIASSRAHMVDATDDVKAAVLRLAREPHEGERK